MTVSIKPIGATHIIVSAIVTAGLIALTYLSGVYHTLSGTDLAAVWITVEPTASYFTSKIDISKSGMQETTSQVTKP